VQLRRPASPEDGLSQPRVGSDLLRWPVLGPFLKWRGSRLVLQTPLFAGALFLVWQGFAGADLAIRNPATVLTWIHFRGALVFALLVAGNLFCLGCPFMLPRALARRLTRPVRQWPARLRNKWAAVALLGAVLIAYERLALWDSPVLTAALILGYFGAALLTDSVFAHAPFCKYVCPLGQFNFVASTVSPLELRVAAPAVCARCATRDCIEGSPRQGRDARRGCELGLFQPQKLGNMDCTLCLDCVYACPHDNIALAPRLPASELWDNTRRSGIGVWSERPDLVALAIVFTFGALLNAFAMASPAQAVRLWAATITGTGSETVFLALLFGFGLVLEPAVLLLTAAWLTRRLAGAADSTLAVLGRFAYALIPVGLGIWAAHYALHLLAGFWSFVPAVQDALRPVGIGLTEAVWHTPSLAPGLIAPAQYFLVGLGTVGTLIVAYRIAERDFPTRTWAAFLPWGTVGLVLGAAAAWVLAQPMDMRGLMIM
jgi:ferredoxin